MAIRTLAGTKTHQNLKDAFAVMLESNAPGPHIDRFGPRPHLDVQFVQSIERFFGQVAAEPHLGASVGSLDPRA